MPELPEVEITARRIDAALRGAEVESAMAPGINALKTFDPPLHAIEGRAITGVRRVGKHLVVDVADGLHLLMHLMSAGRLQLYDKRASLRDRTSRLLLRLADDRELRLREFGTKQAAWVKLLDDDGLPPTRRSPSSGPRHGRTHRQDLAALLAPHGARPLHAVLRDQRVIAGSGGRGSTRSSGPRSSRRSSAATTWTPTRRPRCASDRQRLDDAIEHYERTVTLPIPDKMPMPLEVHRRHGEPCPRCRTTIEAVHYESYVLCYCPAEQTGGKVLKDRRLSRLLK